MSICHILPVPRVVRRKNLAITMILLCLYIITFAGGGGVGYGILCITLLVVYLIYGVSMLYFVFLSF